MPIIPLLIEPEKDELMVSYLGRLAQHNGFDHVSDLLHGYIWPNNPLFNGKQNIRADANNVFPAFYQAVDLPIDPVKFYLDHTLYKGLVPLTSTGIHMQIVTHAFHNNDDFASLIGRPGYLIDDFRVCPICQKEDVETKGFWYYHMAHHMPGVTMCAKHGVPLQVLKRSPANGLKSARLFDTNNEFQIESVLNQEWAHRYSTFSAALFEAKIDTDVSIVHQAILNTLKAHGVYDDTEKLLHCFHDAGCDVMTDAQALSSVKHTMHSGVAHGVNNTSFIRYISFMVLCFPTITDLQNAIDAVPQNHKDLVRFLSLISGQYDIVGDFYKPLLEMVKRDTGEHFLTTLKGFNYGWRENSADAQKTSKQKFEELFQNATDGSYHLLSDFKSNGQNITVLHDICGSEYQIAARGFLIDGRRCNCERSYTPDEARKIVERHKEFKLIDYPIGKYKPCVILHDYCGNTFETTLAAFMKNPKCRRCETIKDHSEENIEQLVKDLVGDEYTVIETEGKANGKITIRHNICGKEYTYPSRSFTDGSRCPYCNNFAKEASFRQYVSEVSDGKYKIGKRIDRRSERYEIIDTETKESKIFKRSRIMQELTRPTPSPILPLSVKHPSNALKTHQDIIWEYLTNHYGPDDYICYNDIPTFKEISTHSMPVEINLLCTRKKKLFRIYKGGHYSIYAFKDVCLTPDEITEFLYIRRNGIRYGCIHGKTLAYELGIISEKPNTTYIMSNIYHSAKVHRRTLKWNISITGAPILITEENYRILQFIDLCWYTKYYGWKNPQKKIADFAKTHDVLMSKVNEYLPHYKPRIQEFVKQMIEEMKL